MHKTEELPLSVHLRTAAKREARLYGARRARFPRQLIWQARAKTDPIDARKLAELLRVTLFLAIWLPDLATPAGNSFFRGRAFLVRERTHLKNRIHGHSTSEHLVEQLTTMPGVVVFSALFLPTEISGRRGA